MLLIWKLCYLFSTIWSGENLIKFSKNCLPLPKLISCAHNLYPSTRRVQQNYLRPYCFLTDLHCRRCICERQTDSMCSAFFLSANTEVRGYISAVLAERSALFRSQHHLAMNSNWNMSSSTEQSGRAGGSTELVWRAAKRLYSSP